MLITEYHRQLESFLKGLPREQVREVGRRLSRTDLYFLLFYACGREDIKHQWLFERCREVQASPNGHVDLWSREHYKSTIITFGKTIQDILASHGSEPLPEWKGREPTFGIFSHSRPIAKGFLRQIKREFESNELLKEWFPDVLYGEPQHDSPKWSEDDGITVRRKSNPKEATVEAWGLVDGQPTSKHFFALVYDDVVTVESVRSPEMMAKTQDSLELSYNLGADGGLKRFAGTRYHFNDAYRTVIDRGTGIPRIYPATEDGQVNGNPVLWTKERLAEKRRDMGPYTFGTQIMLNPKADELHGFRREWIRHYRNVKPEDMNKYILVDAASAKKTTSDYTSMWVIGLAEDQNYYVLDIVRDRLSLTQRADRVFKLHRKWRPLEVRYEKYGLMADIEHMQDRMERESYRFDVVEVGGQTPKADRIKRLVPLFEQKRFWFPETFHATDYQGVTRDLVHDFIEEEYLAFPVPIHDDMLDSLARIAEPELELWFPEPDDYDADSVRIEAAQARGRSKTGYG